VKDGVGFRLYVKEHCIKNKIQFHYYVQKRDNIPSSFPFAFVPRRGSCTAAVMVSSSMFREGSPESFHVSAIESLSFCSIESLMFTNVEEADWCC
jgi:hypothetical protein